MAANTSWHRYGTKFRHCHRICICYLARVGRRLQRVDGNDLLELIELDDDERVLEHRIRQVAPPVRRVLEHAISGRQAAEQQVGTLSGAVVDKMRQAPVADAAGVRVWRALLLLLLLRRRRRTASQPAVRLPVGR